MSSALTNWVDYNIPDVGGDSGAWGTILNATISAFDRTLGGQFSADISGGNVSVTSTDAENMVIRVHGSDSNNTRLVTLPARKRRYLIWINRSDNGGVNFTAAGSGVVISIPAYGTGVEVGFVLWCDGTDLHQASMPVLGDGGGFPGMGGVFFDGDQALSLRAPSSTSLALRTGDSFDLLRFHQNNSAGAPAIAGALDTDSTYNTGLYWIANTTMGVSGAGSELCRFQTAAILLGRSSTSGNVEGAWFDVTNKLFTFERAANPCAIFNRMTSDGQVVRFARQNVVVGSISVTGTTTTYNSSSDGELKDCIEDPDDIGTWKIINSLRPRTFVFKADPEHVHYGLIAQEAFDVFPQAVTGNPWRDLEKGDEPMMIDYSKIGILALWGVRDLEKRLRRLEGGW